MVNPDPSVTFRITFTPRDIALLVFIITNHTWDVDEQVHKTCRGWSAAGQAGH